MGPVKRIITISNIARMQETVRESLRNGKKIGLVPTMGYFHEGHLSLMRAARKETGLVVVSLFVNPIQFGPAEDFNRYPRDMERDLDMAHSAGADILFCPAAADIYPQGFSTRVTVEGLSEILCGRSRPGHFQGVTTVVLKLFNIVRPDIAYFGQKDAQQAIIIKRMAEDLNLRITVKVLPIVRERDGLAMSSRNVYLSGPERRAALCLHKAIQHAEHQVKEGVREAKIIAAQVEGIIKAEPLASLEYVAICNPEDLSGMERIERRALLALAVRIGTTRLIDNTFLEVT